MENDVILIQSPISREFLKEIAAKRFGDMVKAVIDLNKEIMAIGGDLHSDEEACLLQNGSVQENLWGINLYPDLPTGAAMIEYDSMINIRPRQNNRSRSVEDPVTRAKITAIVVKLVQ